MNSELINTLIFYLPAYYFAINVVCIFIFFNLKDKIKACSIDINLKIVILLFILFYQIFYYIFLEKIFKITYLNYQIEAIINLLIFIVLDFLMLHSLFIKSKENSTRFLNKVVKYYLKIRKIYFISIPIRVALYFLSFFCNLYYFSGYLFPEMNFCFKAGNADKQRFFFRNTYFERQDEKPHKEVVSFVRNDRGVIKVFKVLNAVYKKELVFHHSDFVFIGRYPKNAIPISILDIVEIENYSTEWGTDLGKDSITKNYFSQIKNNDSISIYLFATTNSDCENCYLKMFRKSRIPDDKFYLEIQHYYNAIEKISACEKEMRLNHISIDYNKLIDDYDNTELRETYK